MIRNSTIDLYLIKDYPFSDNSNVYDMHPLDHGIHDFVKSYYNKGGYLVKNLSDINISSGRVRVPYTFHTADNYNYMYIKTVDGVGNTKYYYCFINDIVWEDNLNTSTIIFTLDFWNTYRDDIKFHTSFIEREHVATDSIGMHTIDEGFAPSEYLPYSTDKITGGGMIPLVAVGSNNHIVRNNPLTPKEADLAHVLSKSDNYGYNPLLLGPNSEDDEPAAIIVTLTNIVKWLTNANSSSAILGIYLMPKSEVVKARDVYIIEDLEKQTLENYHTCAQYGTGYVAETVNHATDSYPVLTSINGYTPKNLKCYNYPFNFLNVSNKLGNELTLKFEKSKNANKRIDLNVQKDNNINGAMYCVAFNYDGVTGNNLDYTLQSLNYPTIPFVIDSYDAYLSANKNVLANSKNYIENDYNFQTAQLTASTEVTRATQSLSDLQGGINSILGSGANSVGATALSIAGSLINSEVSHQNTMYKINAGQTLSQSQINYSANRARDSFKANLADMASKPDKYCGRYIPNIQLFYDQWGFIVKYTAAIPEQLQAIDNYFSLYGYKVSKFAIPYLWYRPIFDYKKIPDINISGNLPTNVINYIKGLFQDGIRVWHDKDKIFNYQESNAPYTPPT